MEAISITDAKKTLLEIARNVANIGENTVFTKRGKPYVVLMSAAEYESIMETLEILSDDSALKDIKESEKEIAEGNWITLEELENGLSSKSA
ncbi:MAG: type II toxin-antitoxin system Phd/YefM family antitoxin [Candidatus Poribacteria bacterium]